MPEKSRRLGAAPRRKTRRSGLAVPDARFRENVAAHLYYAASRSTREAARIFTKYIHADGKSGWRRDARAWLDLGLTIVERNDSAWTHERCISELAAALMRGKVSDEPAAHAVLADVFWRSFGVPGLLTSLISWFVQERVAGPGDAQIVTEALSRLRNETYRDRTARARLLREVAPLVRWLLQNGAAVLREKDQALLLPFLVEVTAEGDPLNVVLALQYVLANDGTVLCSWPLEDHARVWRAFELAFQHKAAPALAIDFATALAKRPDVAMIPLTDPARFPVAHRAMLTGLTAGRFEGVLPESSWELALKSELPPVGGIRFTNADALDRACRVLVTTTRVDASRPPASAAWARFLTVELIRLHGLGESQPGLEALRRRLEQLGRWSEFAESVASALEEALRGAPGADLPLSILRSCGPREKSSLRRKAVLGAVRALRVAAPAGSSSPERRLADLGRFLTDLLHFPWLDRVGGVVLSQVLERSRSLEFVRLENDEKVRVAGATVHVDRGPFERIVQIQDLERRRATAAMYFFHELVHVHQGIGGKDTVARLRATGSETTLMHLDLAADHAAACLAAAGVPRWRLVWLKGITSDDPRAFPVTRMHTAASRTRKALRSVSVRLDYWVRDRRPDLVDLAGDGYVFADHGPAGGHFLALASGPPIRVLFAASLSQEEARVLSAAADEAPVTQPRTRVGRAAPDPPGISDVDRVLLRLLVP